MTPGGGGEKKKARSKPRQKNFFLFAEWPKFPENKQVLPSHNAILTVPVLLFEDSQALMSSLSRSGGRAALKTTSERSLSKYTRR